MDHEDAEAMELRRALDETRGQIREIEGKLHRHHGPAPRPPRRGPMGPPPHELEHREQLERMELELQEVREAAREAQEDHCQELREEVEQLKAEQCETNELLERLLLQDHPSTVGSAGQY